MTLTANQLEELHQLCAEYKTATLAACKLLNVGNPPDAGKVLSLLNAGSHVTVIFEKINNILRHD